MREKERERRERSCWSLMHNMHNNTSKEPGFQFSQCFDCHAVHHVHCTCITVGDINMIVLFQCIFFGFVSDVLSKWLLV